MESNLIAPQRTELQGCSKVGLGVCPPRALRHCLSQELGGIRRDNCQFNASANELKLEVVVG